MNGTQYGAIPYHETFGYDGFGNLTARQSQSWNGQTDNSDAATYTNNRRGGWGYDADGRNTTIDTRTNTFDAAGQQTAMSATAIAHNGSSYTVNQANTHDGDGAMAREVDTKSNAPGYANTTYYLRSSALGGAIIEEINSSGQKSVGYVYSSGGQLLATQTPNYPTNMVTWKHRTPVGTTQYAVNTYNAVTSRTEFDPLGADLSLTAPEEPPPGEGDGDVGAGHFGGIMDSRWSDFFNLSSGCMRAGVSASCSQAMDSVNGTSNSSQTGGGFRFSMPDWAWEQLAKQRWKKQWAVYMGQEGFIATPPKGWVLVPFDPWTDVQFDILGIKSGLEDALKKKGCREFVEWLLNSVQSKKNPLANGGDIMALFESVVTGKGGFTRTPPPGSAGYGNPTGRISTGDASIFSRGGARTPAIQLIFDTETALHELMHLAGSKNYYSDEQFARAVHGNPAYKSRSPYPPDTPQLRGELKDPGAIGWGAYWNDVLKQKCFENH